MDILIGILITLLSAYLVYFFTVKSKKKEIDIEKEKELNIVLSNLLLAWENIYKVKSIINLLKKPNSHSIIPTKYLPVIMLQNGFLNDRCFQELDNSIDVLKKYDPILFYKIENIGSTHNKILNNFFLPYLKNPDVTFEHFNHNKINEMLIDIEDCIKIVTKQLSKKVISQVNNYIYNKRVLDNNEFINELNRFYYERIIQVIPNDVEPKPTLNEFIEFSQTEEFQEFQEKGFKILINNSIEDIINIASNNPDMSIEEAQIELDKINKLNKAN